MSFGSGCHRYDTWLLSMSEISHSDSVTLNNWTLLINRRISVSMCMVATCEADAFYYRIARCCVWGMWNVCLLSWQITAAELCSHNNWTAPYDTIGSATAIIMCFHKLFSSHMRVPLWSLSLAPVTCLVTWTDSFEELDFIHRILWTWQMKEGRTPIDII